MAWPWAITNSLTCDADAALRDNAKAALRRFENADLIARIHCGYVGKGWDFFKVQKTKSHEGVVDLDDEAEELEDMDELNDGTSR